MQSQESVTQEVNTTTPMKVKSQAEELERIMKEDKCLSIKRRDRVSENSLDVTVDTEANTISRKGTLLQKPIDSQSSSKVNKKRKINEITNYEETEAVAKESRGSGKLRKLTPEYYRAMHEIELVDA